MQEKLIHSFAISIIIKSDAINVNVNLNMNQNSSIEKPTNLVIEIDSGFKKLYKDKVVFTDLEEIIFNNIDYNLIKPMIWWK